MTAPYNRLFEERCIWWTEAQESFDKLKKVPRSSPVLALNWVPFEIECDAFINGIGGVLFFWESPHTNSTSSLDKLRAMPCCFRSQNPPLGFSSYSSITLWVKLWWVKSPTRDNILLSLSEELDFSSKYINPMGFNWLRVTTSNQTLLFNLDLHIVQI